MFPASYFTPSYYWFSSGGEEIPLPNPPSSLLAKRSGGSILLSWVDNAVDETEYYVHRGEPGFTPGVGTRLSADLGPDAESYEDASPPAGPPPWYIIEVVDANGTTYSRRFSIGSRRRRLPPGLPG